MMAKPKLLDLFCGAGGAAMGYHQAGFDVVGVDINPQPYYPFEFIQADAMTFPLEDFDVFHASPPCQAYSRAGMFANRRKLDHPDLIEAIRNRLHATGLPYVIENVSMAGMKLVNPYRLCGSSLGLVDIERHRLFETNFMLLVPPCAHGLRGEARFAGTPRLDGSRPLSKIVNQMASGVSHDLLADAMGIDWIPSNGVFRPRPALCNAIPPAYTELIGDQLKAEVS